MLQYVHLYRRLQGWFKSEQYKWTLPFCLGTVQQLQSCQTSAFDAKVGQYFNEPTSILPNIGQNEALSVFTQWLPKETAKNVAYWYTNNSVAKAYINDENFGSFGNDLNMWKFYNLLTGANKSSYIDSFLDRSLNATEMAVGINAALHGDEHYKWFID